MEGTQQPKASFVKLTRQTMSLRRHFSFKAHGHEPWKVSDTVDGYFKSGVNMVQMLSNGQTYGGKVELSVYASGVYGYEENRNDEYFCATYKNGGKDVDTKMEVINVNFTIGDEILDLFNPLCMLKGLRLVLDEQYKVFVAQECSDQLQRGTYFDSSPLPWATDVYACVDMLASWMFVVEKELPRHEWTSATAKVMHSVSSKYQRLKSYGDCAPEYVETEEWTHIVDNIQEEIMDEAKFNEQLMSIQILTQFFFHEEFTTVADCYSTRRVFQWPHAQVEALYETIMESDEVYTLAYTYTNDFLPIMDIVYTYNKWMNGDFVMITKEGVNPEEYDAQRVKSIATAASFFVNDCAYVVFVEDVETENDIKILDELVDLGVCIKVVTTTDDDADNDVEFYRSKRYDDMFQLIVKGIGEGTVATSFCFNFKSMFDNTASIVQTHGLDNVVCFSPEGHHMHAAAYNVFEPLRFYNPYNPFDTANGDDKYREECKGKHVVLNWASGFGIEAVTRIMAYEPKAVYLVDFKKSTGRECATSIMDSLCQAVKDVKDLRDATKCHHIIVSTNFATLRSVVRNGYKSQSKELCALTFTKYVATDLVNNTGKIKQIVEMFDSCVVSRLKRNNTFLHITDGLDDVFPDVLEKVHVDVRKDNLSQEMRDRNMHTKIRAKPDASYTGERGSVGDDILMPGHRVATLIRSRQFVHQSKKGRKRATQPRIHQPYAGCCISSTQGPRRDGFAPYYFEVYKHPKAHNNAIKELSIQDTLKCKRLYSTPIGKASGLVDTQHFMLWATPALLEMDSTTDRPYHRLYELVCLLAPHCQRITIALPSMHEYVVAPGEVHFDDTKWKRVRNAIMRFQKEDNKVLVELANGMAAKSKTVLDSDAEDSEDEEEEEAGVEVEDANVDDSSSEGSTSDDEDTESEPAAQRQRVD